MEKGNTKIRYKEVTSFDIDIHIVDMSQNKNIGP